MNKHYLPQKQLSVLVLMLLVSYIGYSQNSLVVINPTLEEWTTDYPAIIEEATLRMEPQGIYAKAELEMTLAARSSDDWQESDTLEMVLHFDLPQHAIVFDSYLWVNDEQVQAGIYERNLGTEVYESIAQRSPTPSLLLKMNQGKYQLRIFPLPALESRKLRIDFLVPVQWKDGVAQASLPIALLQHSDEEVPLELEIHENDAFPLLGFSNPEIEFTVEDDILYLSTTNNQLSLAEYISWELPTENGVWLEVDEQNNEYQYLFDTRSQIPGLDSGKDIVMIMHTENAEISEEAIKKILKQAFDIYLNDQARVAIIKDDTVLNPEQPWFTDLESLKAAIENETYSTSFDLPTKIREANIFLGDQAEQSSMVILVSSDTLTNAQNTDITNWLGELIDRSPTLVWDVRNWGSSSNFNFGRNIAAYVPLLQRTGGFISNNGSVEDRLFRAMENRSIKSGFIELEIEPANGLTYADYGNLNISDGEGILPQYRQYGKFVGDVNWEIDYSVFIDNQLTSNTSPVQFTSSNSDQLHRIYIGNKLAFREQNNTSPITIANESKDERILSTKTIFLTIDPLLIAEDGCVGCATMPGTPIVSVESIRQVKWEAVLASNPIEDQLSLRWNIAPQAQKMHFQMIALNGQIIYQQSVQGVFTDGTTFFEWDGLSALPKGAYVIRLLIGNEIQILRLIKS